MQFTTTVIILEKWNVLKRAVFKDKQCSHKEKSTSFLSITFELGSCSEGKDEWFPMCTFPGGSVVKKKKICLAVQETRKTRVQSLGWENPLEKEMATHSSIQFSSVQLLSCVRLPATPWTAACQASLSITSFQTPSKPMSIESVMPSNHLILFSSCLQSFPASGSFPMSHFFSSGGQSLEFQLHHPHQSFQWIFRTNFL